MVRYREQTDRECSKTSRKKIILLLPTQNIRWFRINVYIYKTSHLDRSIQSGFILYGISKYKFRYLRNKTK